MENSTRDIHIFESGSGGDMLVMGNDLTLSEKLFQSIYIALFGGNFKEVTSKNRIKGEQRFDFWANELLFKNKPNKQMNSLTEKTLTLVAINSSGRLKIQSAVEEDLRFLKKLVNLTIDVLLTGKDEVTIKIKIGRIENQENIVFNFIWSNLKNELIIDKII